AADALDHATEPVIGPRDLNPANVVVTPDQRVKVLDFGLSQRVWHEGAAYSATRPATKAGVAGTIAYMAPEALRGAPADARCDIWALGVIVYELATGAPPFDGHTEFELSSRILHEPPPEPPAFVPAGIRAIINRCLAKNPDERFQHAADVRTAFRELSSDRARSAAGSAGYGPRWLVGTVLLVLLAAGVVLGPMRSMLSRNL